MRSKSDCSFIQSRVMLSTIWWRFYAYSWWVFFIDLSADLHHSFIYMYGAISADFFSKFNPSILNTIIMFHHFLFINHTIDVGSWMVKVGLYGTGTYTKNRNRMTEPELAGARKVGTRNRNPDF